MQMEKNSAAVDGMQFAAEGNGWGAYLRFGIPKALQKNRKKVAPVFPRWIQSK